MDEYCIQDGIDIGQFCARISAERKRKYNELEDDDKPSETNDLTSLEPKVMKIDDAFDYHCPDCKENIGENIDDFIEHVNQCGKS